LPPRSRIAISLYRQQFRSFPEKTLYSFDQLCFLLESTDFRIEAREGDEGYENLIAQMQINIPGVPA
jgi:hypothetical protein